MKQLFLAVFLIAAITSTKAQLLEKGKSQPHQRAIPNTLAFTAADIFGKSDEPQVQALNWTEVYRTEIQAFFYFSTSNVANIIEYDQATNSLGIVRSQAFFRSSGRLQNSRLGVMRATVPGAAWLYDSFELPSSFIGSPNFVQFHDGPNPLQWPLFVVGTRYDSGDGRIQRVLSGIIRESGSVSEIELGDVPDNPAGYQWYNQSTGNDSPPVDIDLLAVEDNTSAIGVGRLNRTPSVQWGAYGLFDFNLPAGDFNSHSVVDEWYTDKFVDPAGIGSTRNADAIIDSDNEGNIYTAFNNLEPGATERTVMVSKSTDFGASWSPSFNVMPVSLINDVLASLGNGIDVFDQYSQMPYQGSAFIVTGRDEYSYFFRALAGIRDQTNPQSFNIALHMIMEARYKAGVWSLTPVAALNLGLRTGIEGLLLEYPQYSLSGDRIAQDSVLRVSVVPSPRSIELGVAKTADGNAIVLKYLDQKDSSVIQINPPIQISIVQRNADGSSELVDGPEPMDTLIQSDIFLTYRNLNEDTWSTPNNVTNDVAFNHRTYMPSVVPSLTQVPLVQVTSSLVNNISRNLPASVIAAMSDQFGIVHFAMVDATTVGVEDDERTYDFRINSIVPNPALNLADVTFTLDKGAVVSADLFDVLGNKVRSLIAPSFVGAGVNGVSVDVNALAAGQYYVTITVGGNRITRSLVVIK